MRTEQTMINIPISASPDARDSLWISRYKESGYEMQSVQRQIMNCRFVRTRKTGIISNRGKADRMT